MLVAEHDGLFALSLLCRVLLCVVSFACAIEDTLT